MLSSGIAYSWPLQFALHGLGGDDVKTVEVVHDVAEGGEDIKVVMPLVIIPPLFVHTHTSYLLRALWERWRSTIYRPG